MLKRLSLILFLFVLLPTSILGAEAKSPIHIGAIFVLSGPAASWGLNAQRGTMLAVEKINAAGGVGGRRLEVIYEDTGGSTARAVEAYKKLVKIDRVEYILGPNFQKEAMAVAPLALSDKIFLLGATYLPNPPVNMFPVWMDAEFEADLLAEHVIKKHKRVGILSSQDSWESLIAARFKKTFQEKGGEIASFFEPVPDSTDVRSEVLKTKKESLEAIFISSYLLFAKYTRELQRLAVEVPIYGQELDVSVLNSAGEAAEGVVFITPAEPKQDFRKSFKKRFGEEPDLPAVQSYDTIYILARALQDTDQSFESLSRHFESFPDYAGASGTFRLQAGRTVVDTEFRIVKNGKIERL